TRGGAVARARTGGGGGGRLPRWRVGLVWVWSGSSNAPASRGRHTHPSAFQQHVEIRPEQGQDPEHGHDRVVVGRRVAPPGGQVRPPPRGGEDLPVEYPVSHHLVTQAGRQGAEEGRGGRPFPPQGPGGRAAPPPPPGRRPPG